MKNKSDIANFFWHYLSEIAIGQGWDFESEMVDSLKDVLDKVAFTDKTKRCKVLVSDLIDVTNNVQNPAFNYFCTIAYNSIKGHKDLTEHTPLMVSMHSGSSDYFTWGMLKDKVENDLS